MASEQNLCVEDVYPSCRLKISEDLPPPQSSPRNQIFSEAMLEHSTTRHRRSPRQWALSFFIHFAILSVLLIVPLYFTQGIDMKRMEVTLLVAPLPPMAAPPPPPPALARVVHTPPKVFTPGKLTAPTFIPKAVPATASDAAPPEESFAGSMGGVTGGIPGGQIGGIVGGMPNVSAPVVAAPAPTAERPRGPVRVGGTVKPPRLIFGPAPVYPILARQSQVQGMVVIEAIIDEHGNVVQEKVISGHPLLIQAALKAVSQRKYEPTILDGEPTPVDLRVEVNFQM
jgi:periplasmic protein TonB